MEKIEYYKNPENENEVAVLVSYGYGAGWSTWNREELCCDKRIVEYWLEHNDAEEEEVKAFCESIGYEDVFCGGWHGIKLEYIPAGSKFIIEEYDGCESLIMEDDLSIIEPMDGEFDLSPEHIAQIVTAFAVAGLSYNTLGNCAGYILFTGDDVGYTFKIMEKACEWIDGVIFDDPETNKAVERVMHPNRYLCV